VHHGEIVDCCNQAITLKPRSSNDHVALLASELWLVRARPLANPDRNPPGAPTHVAHLASWTETAKVVCMMAKRSTVSCDS